MNNSKSGLTPSATSCDEKTRASAVDPIWSGPTGMDQSTRLGSCAAPSTTNPGNSLPPLPPIKHGN